ncbi:hypothetical protein GCM10022222_42200 [Amycolatopsis ultiminotia]|uniref:DUF2784 domain-containing protein n=1 Tax=Amycolatopsis ultiminotia TaxID=543629 RepID=A0ABP6WP75_9PSEU
MIGQLLAYFLLCFHFVVLGFLIFGGFLAWRWPRVLLAHFPLVVWGVLSSVFPLDCPITAAENWARGIGGLPQYDRGFVETYLAGVVYDPDHVNHFRAAMALFVLAGWAGAWWCARRRAARRTPVPAGTGNGRISLR